MSCTSDPDLCVQVSGETQVLNHNPANSADCRGTDAAVWTELLCSHSPLVHQDLGSPRGTEEEAAAAALSFLARDARKQTRGERSAAWSAECPWDLT